MGGALFYFYLLLYLFHFNLLVFLAYGMCSISARGETEKFCVYMLTPQLLGKVLPFLQSQGTASKAAGGRLHLTESDQETDLI